MNYEWFVSIITLLRRTRELLKAQLYLHLLQSIIVDYEITQTELPTVWFKSVDNPIGRLLLPHLQKWQFGMLQRPFPSMLIAPLIAYCRPRQGNGYSIYYNDLFQLRYDQDFKRLSLWLCPITTDMCKRQCCKIAHYNESKTLERLIDFCLWKDI